jgi:hypothetical protein
MQQYINLYIYIYKNCFYKVGDLKCSRACLVRRNWVGGPNTQVDPLLTCLPRTPPVPKLLVDRTRSAPLELLLATPYVILYDAITYINMQTMHQMRWYAMIMMT